MGRLWHAIEAYRDNLEAFGQLDGSILRIVATAAISVNYRIGMPELELLSFTDEDLAAITLAALGVTPQNAKRDEWFDYH